MSRDSLVNPFVLGLFLEMMIYLLIFLWNGYYKASSLEAQGSFDLFSDTHFSINGKFGCKQRCN